MRAQFNKQSFIEFAWLSLLMIVLAFFYLYPGPLLMFQGSLTKVMHDGTDAATLPWQYGLVKYWMHTDFSNLFYGTVFSPFQDAPDGSLLWMCWIEKVIAIVGVPFVSLEQLSTFVTFAILVLNGWSFYYFARSMDWPKPVCVALAICWAFNPYVRGRAKVHTALAAIYFLPLTFLAINLIKKYRDNLSLGVAAGAFLVAAMAPHYYLIVTGFMVPFLAWYLLKDNLEDWQLIVVRALVASIPAIMLVGWSFTNPAPKDVMSKSVMTQPKTGEVKDKSKIHPFLNTYGARPIDFFSGDVAIGKFDLNPFRGAMTAAIYENEFDRSNPHERSNGIRWLIWGMIIFGIFIFFNDENKAFEFRGGDKQRFIYWGIFTVFSFFLTLSPKFIGVEALSPAVWVYSVISQFRVPSRAGILVHFGCLSLAGILATRWLYRLQELKVKKSKKKTKSEEQVSVAWVPAGHTWAKRLTIPFVLPLLVVVDFPPAMNAMPMAPVKPVYSQLSPPVGGGDDCGLGMYFPYVSHNFALREMYYFLQSMRGSRCDFLNGYQNEVRNQKLLQRFALHKTVISAIERNDANFKNGLVQFARCVPLEWIVFDERVPRAWVSSVCTELGWEYSQQNTCRSLTRNVSMQRLPEVCL